MCLIKKLLIPILLIPILSVTLSAQDIHTAVKARDINAVRILLKKYPKLAISQNATGDTPLHLAAESGHDEIAGLLISMTANVNIKNKRGLTPLFFAAFYGRKNIAKMLLAKGADTDIKSDIGMYPIHYAVYANRVGVLELLIEYGADMNLEDEDCRTPLELALFQGHKSVIDILLRNKAKIRVRTKSDGIQDLHAAVRIGHSALFKKIVQLGVDIHSKDFMHRTLLHNAAAGGMVNIGTDLLQKGKKINVRDVYGSTPLHEAAHNGHKETVVLLISKGADINCKRPDGATPLYLAKKAGHKEIVSLLKARGAVDTPLRFPGLTGDYLGQKPPGKKAELFAPGLLSTGVIEVFNETRCSPKKLVFSRVHPDSPRTNPVYYPELITELKKGKWTTPSLAPQFRSPNDPNLSLTPDENIIYTALHRSQDGKKVSPWGFNLWVGRKTVEGSYKLRMLKPPINTPKHDSWPSATRDGTIYFYSDREDGLGGCDIYRTRLKNGNYSEVENLGPPINTKSTENDPFIARDESYLVFHTAARGGYGGGDLFVAFRKPDGSWSNPINLGKGVNTSSEDNRPMLTSDGKYLFFVREIYGNFDVYWVSTKIIEEKKPDELK